MPRPTKLSPQRQAQICEHVAQGHSREVAAQACGIAATTVYRWMKRGEANPDSPYGEFCTALKRADAEAEIACLRTIKAAANAGDWKAAAWMLERRYPEKWGRRRAVHSAGGIVVQSKAYARLRSCAEIGASGATEGKA